MPLEGYDTDRYGNVTFCRVEKVHSRYCNSSEDSFCKKMYWEVVSTPPLNTRKFELFRVNYGGQEEREGEGGEGPKKTIVSRMKKDWRWVHEWRLFLTGLRVTK